MPERQIAGWVLDRDLPPQSLLQPLHIAHDDGQGFLGVRQRQQIVVVAPVQAAPGEVIGHEHRFDTLHQRRNAIQVRIVDAVDGSERKPHRMHGERIVAAQLLHGPQRRGRRQIVLGMDLQKADRRQVARNLREMRCPKPDAGR